MESNEGEKLLLFPIQATVEEERAGVRMGPTGMQWQGRRMSEESYYEVASDAGAAARQFRERTKTGSNGHTGRVGRPMGPSPAAAATLREFADAAGRSSLGSYYRDYSDDEQVTRFLAACVVPGA